MPNAEEMIRQLVIGQETIVRSARAVLPVTGKANDEPTADLLTQRMQVHEKNAWMLRSIQHFSNADKEYGNRITEAINELKKI